MSEKEQDSGNAREGTGPWLPVAELKFWEWNREGNCSSELGTAHDPTLDHQKHNQGKEVALCIPCVQGLPLGLMVARLQCNYSFVDFHGFVNTEHTDNPLHFSWRAQMLNSPSHFALLWKRQIHHSWQGISPCYPSFLFWQRPKHTNWKMKRRTFNVTKLTKLLCAMVWAWVSHELRFTVTEQRSASNHVGCDKGSKCQANVAFS